MNGSLVPDEARQHAEALAAELGTAVDEVPQLTRVLEDLSALRRYEELVNRGESKTHAIRRTAQSLGFHPEALRYRINVLEARRGT